MCSRGGDIDLGSTDGIPLSSVLEGESVQVPVQVNTGSSSLHSMSFTLQYSTAMLQLVGVSLAEGWSGDLQSTSDSQLGLVTISSSLTSPVVGVSSFAIVTFSATAVGVATIRGVINSILDINMNTIGSPTPKPIVAGNVAMEILASRRRRSVVDCVIDRPLGDADGNCVFNSSDTEFLLSYLAESLLNDSMGFSTEQITIFDTDRNSIVDPSDAYYLSRVLNGLINFLVGVSSTPVSIDNGCVLTLNATLVGGTGVPPDPALIEVYFDISLNVLRVISRGYG